MPDARPGHGNAHCRTGLVLGALNMTLTPRRPKQGSHHFDPKATQCNSIAFGLPCQGSGGAAFDGLAWRLPLEGELVDRRRFGLRPTRARRFSIALRAGAIHGSVIRPSAPAGQSRSSAWRRGDEPVLLGLAAAPAERSPAGSRCSDQDQPKVTAARLNRSRSRNRVNFIVVLCPGLRAHAVSTLL